MRGDLLVEPVRLDADIRHSLEHVEHFRKLKQYSSTTLQYTYRNNCTNTMPMLRWYAL